MMEKAGQGQKSTNTDRVRADQIGAFTRHDPTITYEV
jgi:hypothetical protein